MARSSFLIAMFTSDAILAIMADFPVPVSPHITKGWSVSESKYSFTLLRIILIDSLDLLSTFENGHKLEWLPSRIAVNVKIVLSVNSDNEDCLTRMRHKCPDSIVDIPPFTNTDCENVMKVMMNNQKRNASYDQWKIVQKAFQKCTLPVYVRLVFEEVRLWHSF
jgi:hypothetical protein